MLSSLDREHTNHLPYIKSKRCYFPRKNDSSLKMSIDAESHPGALLSLGGKERRNDTVNVSCHPMKGNQIVRPGSLTFLAKVGPHLHIQIFIPFAKKSICGSLDVCAFAKDLSL